jgi:hypothetical protein
MIPQRISRRTVLRGAGAAMALPMLEIMTPVGRAAEKTAAPRRIAFFYIPNGVVQSTWNPKETGKNFALSPTLEPVEPIREKISLYSNLDRIKVSGTDGHAQASTCWLSSARPEELSPAGYPLKRTLDQIIAAETGKVTPFRSLELSCNSYTDNKESVYFDNISWYGHGHVAKSMRDPQQVFNRLFAVKQQQTLGSVLDLVAEDAKSLRSQLGRIDQHKLDEYTHSVRTVEQQIARVRDRQADIQKLNLKAPVQPWTAMRRDEFIQIQGDLMILALQTDLTRVASLMVSPERWGTPQMVHGLFEKPIQHHGWTHGQGNARVRSQLAKLDRYHVEQYTRLVQKMDAIREGERSLLDNSAVILGSGLSSGAKHVCTNLPTLVAGSCGGQITTNRHVRSAKGTPVANLWLSLAQAMGVKTKRFADSTGSLSLT